MDHGIDRGDIWLQAVMSGRQQDIPGQSKSEIEIININKR